jgi:cytochrome c oxidase cbb3-type subunit 3
MPPFDMNDHDISAIAAFIHAEKKKAESQVGGRRGVDPSDLQTGNPAAGKKYFEGEGGCSGCHSPTGDLAHVATKFVGLKLEMRLLYPEGAPATATVTLASGEKFTGKLAYQDEWHVALTDAQGWYRSWPLRSVKVKIDDPAQAHADLLAKYTDDDIHNLMAYLQTLR